MLTSARRLLCSVFAVVVGVLMFASAPVLAAPLEAPELSVESIAATTTTLHGVLNPLSAGGAGTYEFLYKQGKAGCTGGSKVPAPAGMMTGAEHEELYEGISGLIQGTEYTACLRAVNTTSVPSEEATSAAVTFTTAIPPETPTVISPVKSVSVATATLEGVLNPHAAGDPGSYEFLYQQSATECEYGTVASGSALGHEGEAVKTEVVLLPNTTYTFCLRASNDAGEFSALSTPVTFTTLAAAPPVIEGESSAGLGATEARIEALINPENSETTYHFEYGPAAGSYDASTPVREISARVSELPLRLTVEVSAVLTGLVPGTPYHYRVVASNALSGELDGPDQMFTTLAVQGTGSPSSCPNEQLRAEQPYALELPDCRAYEMVSPLETLGNDAVDSFNPTYARASVSGEAVTYASAGAFANPTGTTGKNQFISRRGPEGWSTQSVTPLHDPSSAETNPSYESVDFTPELTEGVANTNAALTSESPGSGEQQLYIANFADSSYRYLGEEEDIAGSSTDLSHVVFDEKYTFGLEAAVTEWVRGQMFPVSIENDETVIPGTVGSPSAGLPKGYSRDKNIWHAVSEDGSRVYFTSPVESGQVFVRVNPEQRQSPMDGRECTVAADGCTIEVSASQKTDGYGPGGVDLNPGSAEYQGASADGSRVFFTSDQELTNDANTGMSNEQQIIVENAEGGTYTLTFKGQTTVPIPYDATGKEIQSALEALSSVGAANVSVLGSSVTFQGALAGSEQPPLIADGSLLSAGGTVRIYFPARLGNDLYEYDLETGKLKDLSVDDADGRGADVLHVVQISEEGAYVYFVAEGAFAEGATPGKLNLYVSHEGGAPVFIATLSQLDGTDWAGPNQSGFGGSAVDGPEDNTAVVSPSGNRLAFISEESLTGYDNEQVEQGECENEIEGNYKNIETGKCREVYLYDAETGGLVCASCDPTGARPRGPSTFTPQSENKFGLYRPRNLLEDGVLFFDSSDELVPHASDGRVNVYEYEGGRVYAISDVAGGFESFFLDASPDGKNVFFGTADQLLRQDVSNNVVVYDARVDGGFPVSVAPPSCDNGDSCKPPPAPQLAVFGAPGSATFSGPGNIAPVPPLAPVAKGKAKAVKCAKGYEKKKGKCVKQRKPKKHAGKSSERRGRR